MPALVVGKPALAEVLLWFRARQLDLTPQVAERREENSPRTPGEILVRHNLMIWNAAIYWTLVVRDILIVGPR
jgi:hypothetical protein